MFAASAVLASPARADVPDRTRLNMVLAVLRSAPAEAGRACLSSMGEVHALERGLPGTRDQVEFSYQKASQLCGVDAQRVCRTVPADAGGAACRRLDDEFPP